MSSPNQPMLLRFAHASLRITLRVWPEESLPWGHALAAELHEIDQPWEALCWAVGGFMLFARSTVSHFLDWLKLPAGARLSGSSSVSGNGPLLPRRPRLFTAAVLVATALVFLLPQSQEAFSTITASWNGYGTSDSDIRALERLGTRAEKENDARTLAFVAMTLPHSGRSTALANRAVTLDPSLFWINAVRLDGWPEFAEPSKEELAQIPNTDTGNAYPELVAARVRMGPRFVALTHSHSPTDQEFDALAASDPEWLAHMERAFSSPRYDSYANRRWQLTREVWSREHSFSPAVVFYSLWSHSLPDRTSIDTYTRIQFRKAREAAHAGHTERGEALINQVDTFGSLMGRGQTFFETYLGWHLSYEAASELLHLYQVTNQPAKAALASQRLEQVAARITANNKEVSAKWSRAQGFEGRAFFVNFITVAGILLLLATVVSLLVVELRSAKQVSGSKIGRGLVCLTADWAPVSCLLAFIATLWAFQPFARILAAARTDMTASDAWFTLHHDGLFRLAPAFPFYDRLWATYHLWLAATYALGALALFILFRRFLVAKRA